MIKRFILIASLALIGTGLFAADDYEVRKELRDLRAGRIPFRVGEDGGVGVKTDAIVEETAGNGISVDGVTLKDGAIVETGISKVTAGTASPTNGAAVTATASIMILTPIGGANDTTNTVTLANAVAGQYLELHVAAGSTNLLGLADTGNLKLTAAFVGDETDNIVLRGIGTNWVEIGRSDN